MSKKTENQGRIETLGDGEKILILQDVNEDLDLQMTTRIEGKIAAGVNISSNDPDVHLSVLKLPPNVEIRIEGDFSSIRAQSTNIEARSVDIGLLENVDYAHKTPDGESIPIQGRSYITAEDDIVIDNIRGRKDNLRKDVPNVDIMADKITIEGKVTEGHFYPVPLTDKELGSMPTYEPPGAVATSKKPEIDIEELKARLEGYQNGPKISKQNVDGSVNKDVPQKAATNEGTEMNKSDKKEPTSLQERLDSYKQGPRISKVNVSDLVNKNTEKTSFAEQALSKAPATNKPLGR